MTIEKCLVDVADELESYRKSSLTPSECAELAQAKADGRMVVLPDKWLETLKLLTISAICYQEWNDAILSKLRDSQDIRDLFMKLPTVQYSSNHIKLMRLAESGLDVNIMANIDSIVDIMYPSEAEDALRKDGVV